MSFLDGGLLSKLYLNRAKTPQTIQIGSGIETPSQIQKVITKDIVRRKKAESKPEDDTISNEELANAFQKLNFTSKRVTKQRKKKAQDSPLAQGFARKEIDDYDVSDPRMIGGSIAYL